MATPHALTHALVLDPADSTPAGAAIRTRRLGRIRSGLLIGATTALAVGLMPGTAVAEPGQATSAEQAAQLVADSSHELEVVTERLNEAKVLLEQHQAEAAAAQQAATDAEARLGELDGQIRQLARTAYTGENVSELSLLLTSNSADDLVSRLGTLDVIAGHTNQVVTSVARASAEAEEAQARADAAVAEAQTTYDDIAAQQSGLEAQIADYQAQYDALSAPQRAAVDRQHTGAPVAAPSSVVANSSAAQAAVNTAMAQLGDPYVWGASGPNAFDCSGLMQYAYAAAGISLPHSSRMQSGMGAPVSRSELQPGDLVFFYSPVSHVGMYIGNGQMVHASTSGKPVMVASVDSMGGYNSARRIAG